MIPFIVLRAFLLFFLLTVHVLVQVWNWEDAGAEQIQDAPSVECVYVTGA